MPNNNKSILISPTVYANELIILPDEAFEELRIKLDMINPQYDVVGTYVACDGGLYALLNFDTTFPAEYLSDWFCRDSYQWRRSTYYHPAIYLESLLDKGEINCSTMEGHKYVEASSYWYVVCRKALKEGKFAIIDRIFHGLHFPVDFAFNVLQALISIEQIIQLLEGECLQTEQFNFELVHKNAKPLICLRRN